ncbi:hypothetical protein U2G91_01890 [Rhodococcoides fascians]|uniref:hypothetical protein n=1 Tax=Rhodococcoides fascians TaxID=1828 RepID=UPI002ACD3762|nr:hypothetical protein [Rhodococcus fascians]WQH28759.1 hypothetical protein U2G91_01890 [Rhodococcus fascians]
MRKDTNYLAKQLLKRLVPPDDATTDGSHRRKVVIVYVERNPFFLNEFTLDRRFAGVHDHSRKAWKVLRQP